MSLPLKDRVAVVTGGAQGIGRAVARRLVEAGAAVAIADLNFEGAEKAAESLESAGASVKAFRLDVTDWTSIQTACESVLVQFHQIDVLVNNAGIVGKTAPIQDQDVADWNRVIAADLSGVFLCCKAVIPHMISRQSGRIINLASVAGKEGNPNMIPYCAAKAGVIGLTKALAMEVARCNILVNAVTPALIDTAMLEDLSPDQRTYLTAKIPIGRIGTPEEVAAMVLWLATDEVRFSTGAVFDISGGRSTY